MSERVTSGLGEGEDTPYPSPDHDSVHLRDKGRLWVEHVSDPAHRSHNGVALALSGAGLLKSGPLVVTTSDTDPGSNMD